MKRVEMVDGELVDSDKESYVPEDSTVLMAISTEEILTITRGLLRANRAIVSNDMRSEVSQMGSDTDPTRLVQMDDHFGNLEELIAEFSQARDQHRHSQT